MIWENLRQHRFNQWQSFFSKFQNAESPDDYVYPQNSWLPAQKINSQGPPEDVKELIDKVWEKEGKVLPPCFGIPTSSKHTGSNVSSGLDQTGNLFSLINFSSDDDYDDCDDDYESYQSDSDSEDAKPLPVDQTKAFIAIFRKTNLNRLQALQQRRKKSASIFDALLEERSSHEKSIQTTEVSSPTKRVSIDPLEKFSSQKHSPHESKKSRFSDVPSTASPHEYQGHHSKTSVASSLVSATSRNEDSFDQQPWIRSCVVTLTNQVKPTENKSASKESSFSEHLKRMKINSPSKPNEGETPRRVKATSRLNDGLKDRTNGTLSLQSPTDEKRKRKIYGSPSGNCQSSLEFPLKDSRVEVISESNASWTSPSPSNSSGNIIVMDSSILRRRLCSERKSIRALKKGRSLFEI